MQSIFLSLTFHRRDIFWRGEVKVAVAFALWLRIRGNLSPPVLAKNKGTAVFRLVSARTNFSSEKSSCYRPTSEGICFAKQSEQWLTRPLLSQARLARACPCSEAIRTKAFIYFQIPPPQKISSTKVFS